MKKTRNLVLLIALALVLVAGAVGGGYAYWQGAVSAPTDVTQSGTIEIGTAKDVTTKITVSGGTSGQHLVPAGRADHSEEDTAVESITLNLTAKWEEDGTAIEADANGTLTVTASNILIGGNATHKDKVKITITPSSPAITLAGEVAVEVVITLTEPADATEYEAIAGKQITFDLVFNITLS